MTPQETPITKETPVATKPPKNEILAQIIFCLINLYLKRQYQEYERRMVEMLLALNPEMSMNMVLSMELMLHKVLI